MTGRKMIVKDGHAYAPVEPGIGIDWDREAVEAHSIKQFTTGIRAK